MGVLGVGIVLSLLRAPKRPAEAEAPKDVKSA